jgi:hypothetical protein
MKILHLWATSEFGSDGWIALGQDWSLLGKSHEVMLNGQKKTNIGFVSIHLFSVLLKMLLSFHSSPLLSPAFKMSLLKYSISIERMPRL